MMESTVLEATAPKRGLGCCHSSLPQKYKSACNGKTEKPDDSCIRERNKIDIVLEE